jgi:membrane associated rhomboid family serine protease
MFPLKDNIRSREFPIVNWLIIGANVLFFVVESALPERQLYQVIMLFGLVPARFGPDWWMHPFLSLTFFTSMFMHGGWLHLISNVWALYIFGDNVEDRMGHGRYLLFYLIGGVAAGVAQVLIERDSTIPMVGASGAISAVMAAYLILFPRARVVSLVPLFILPWLVEIPALIYLGFWFVSQLFNGLFSLAPGMMETAGGVAWWAHVGGFVAGAILVKPFQRRHKYRRWNRDEYYPW